MSSTNQDKDSTIQISLCGDVMTGRGIDQIESIRKEVAAHKQESDIVIASIHWGSNWRYEVPATETVFARGLIDHAARLLANIINRESKAFGIEVVMEELDSMPALRLRELQLYAQNNLVRFKLS